MEIKDNKLKIAIITLPLNYNYGGILQAYALQTVLKRYGFEVEHLEQDSHIAHLWWKIPFVYMKRIYRKYILKDKWISINENFRVTICRNTDKFVSQYINRRFVRKDEWNKRLADEYDVIIVGSDQIWRPKFIGSLLPKAFLDFAQESNLKRIAYATSFGSSNCEYAKDDLMKISALLKRFNAISVREESGIKMCEQFFGVSAVQMIDPTLLLSVDDYISLFKENITPSSNGDLMVYVLDKTDLTMQFVSKVAENYSLKPFILGVRDDLSSDYSIEERIPARVEQWLRGFYDAKLIVTDSFHACVFSILFNKPFLVFSNKERGLARIESLLNMFGLSECFIGESYVNYSVIPVINWNSVNQILCAERMKAMSFLLDNICE